MASPALILPKVNFPTIGWEVINWIEAMLCHGRGDVMGSNIHLDEEECLHLAWCYRIWPKGHVQEGRRLIHRAIYVRNKGARKSELSAMIACAEAVGPVRFGGWDARGEPVGIPVIDPYIRVMATEEGQSSNVWDHITYMMENGRVANEYNIDIGRSSATSTRIFIKEPTGGEMTPSTSGDYSKDGGRESFVVTDEGHLMVTPGLVKMHRIVSNNTGKRKLADPWIHEPTTAWLPGQASITEQAHDKYAHLPIEEAVVNHGVLFDHRKGDPPKIFNRDDSLMLAIRSAYGPYKSDWIDFHKTVRLIRDAEDPEQEAYRFFLGIPRPGTTQWVAPDQIRAVLGEVDVNEGDSVAVGFDGSESDDHSSLMGCTEAGDLFTIGIWVPSEPGWKKDVNEAVEWTFDNFKVVRFYPDPAYWSEYVDIWVNKYGSPPVTSFVTSEQNVRKMAFATGVLKSAITRDDPDERITIDPTPRFTDDLKRDGKPILQWHFENARARKRRLRIDERTEDMYTVRKEQHTGKIDSVVASILARRARDDAVRNPKGNEFQEPSYGYVSW